MVKLTAELIEQSAQYTNALRDRELDLRGENLIILESLLLNFKNIISYRPVIRNFRYFSILRPVKVEPKDYSFS